MNNIILKRNRHGDLYIPYVCISPYIPHAAPTMPKNIYGGFDDYDDNYVDELCMYENEIRLIEQILNNN